MHRWIGMGMILLLVAGCAQRSTPEAVSAVAGSPSNTDVTRHLQTAERLLSVVRMDRVMDQTIEKLVTVQLEQKPGLRPYRDVMLAFFKKHMSFASLKDDLAEIYVQHFSERELEDLIAFYESPTGQKVAMLTPELMNQGARLGMGRVQANLGELTAMIQAEADRQNASKEKTKQ